MAGRPSLGGQPGRSPAWGGRSRNDERRSRPGGARSDAASEEGRQRGAVAPLTRRQFPAEAAGAVEAPLFAGALLLVEDEVEDEPDESDVEPLGTVLVEPLRESVR